MLTVTTAEVIIAVRRRVKNGWVRYQIDGFIPGYSKEKPHKFMWSFSRAFYSF